MKNYMVVFVRPKYRGREGMYEYFLCKAANIVHAMEQCRDANPDDLLVTVYVEVEVLC